MMRLLLRLFCMIAISLLWACYPSFSPMTPTAEGKDPSARKPEAVYPEPLPSDSLPPSQTGKNPTEMIPQAPEVKPSQDSCAPGRATQDRVDDTNQYQLHFIYATPSDGMDRQLDTAGTLDTSINLWNDWFAARADGLKLRLDRCQNKIDITFARLGQSTADLNSKGAFLRDEINREIRRMGFTARNKIYLVFYEGQTVDLSCAQAANPSTRMDSTAVVYLQGTFSNPSIPPCNSHRLGQTQPSYLEFAALHEVFHLLNVNQSLSCSPNAPQGGGHVGDDPNDLMYAGSSPWTPALIDFGRDDYFKHGKANCYDVAQSVFLDPLPAAAVIPPSW
jgi:hypothetical protein